MDAHCETAPIWGHVTQFAAYRCIAVWKPQWGCLYVLPALSPCKGARGPEANVKQHAQFGCIAARIPLAGLLMLSALGLWSVAFPLSMVKNGHIPRFIAIFIFKYFLDFPLTYWKQMIFFLFFVGWKLGDTTKACESVWLTQPGMPTVLVVLRVIHYTL